MGRRLLGVAAACVVAVGLLFVSPLLLAEGSLPKPSYSSFVDWQKNRITIDASVEVSSLATMVPDARSKAEQLIRADQTSMIENTLFPIVADSFHTVGDLASTSARTFTALQNLIKPGNEQYAKLSTDLSKVTVRYQIPIFPNLGSIFVNQIKANPPNPLLGFVPTTKFSGIVIYAKGELPVHGESRNSELEPSLFPRIWDQNMDLLASADTVDPKVLRGEGMAAFSDNTDEKPFTSRIGLVPFHTVAVGIFGKHPTDVIISNQAAARILASPDNIRLLTEGRILIITDLPRPNVTSGG